MVKLKIFVYFKKKKKRERERKWNLIWPLVQEHFIYFIKTLFNIQIEMVKKKIFFSCRNKKFQIRENFHNKLKLSQFEIYNKIFYLQLNIFLIDNLKERNKCFSFFLIYISAFEVTYICFEFFLNFHKNQVKISQQKIEEN